MLVRTFIGHSITRKTVEFSYFGHKQGYGRNLTLAPTSWESGDKPAYYKRVYRNVTTSSFKRLNRAFNNLWGNRGFNGVDHRLSPHYIYHWLKYDSLKYNRC